MKALSIVLSGIVLSLFLTSAGADETEGNVYLGFSLSSLALDGERVPGIPTRSPGHTPKVMSVLLGYQFNDFWAVDLTLGTDVSSNVDTSRFSINGYRYFGQKNWKPYLSAGISSLKIGDAVDDTTQQFLAGLGVSGSLNDNLELRVGYQHLFDLGDASYNDDNVVVALNWHFKKAKPVAIAKTMPKAQPESVPVMKEVIDTMELQVQFDLDKANIKPSFDAQLASLAKLLNENADASITIEGHTCNLGSEKYNQALSERRSAAVKQVLVQTYGVSADQVRSVGYGETRPIADNSTEAGREKNRRAIVVILRSGNGSE